MIHSQNGHSRKTSRGHGNGVIACGDCDLLQRRTIPPPGGAAVCSRCGAVLYRNIPHGPERATAMLITAAVLFLPANVFPLFALEARGARISATLWGIVQILVRRDMPIVALMVFATAMLAPALQIAAMLYLLLPLRGGRVPVGFALVMRWVDRIRQWNMAEVFMVGALVSVTRLSSFATLTPDVALWAYGGLTLSLAAASASFDPADLWNRADRAAARSKP